MSSPITLLGRAGSACRKANGRVKKGWRLGKGGRCIKAKGRRGRRR